MSENNENQPASQGIKPWIPLILALIYTVSPIDLVPDFIPIVGWFEDALLVIVSGLNGIQNGVLEANSSLRTLIKYLKWGLLIIGGIAILIVVLLVVLVFKVVSK
ncbi:YkvA family protein [Brachyspira aalborgi]|uniref:YkvA family protein n=1 Tax=Brachyspira aalborgi TaxID=29522 RepID=UPI00266639F8|nr:YkvA family protein [Brachyspira aalborgi]